MKAQDDRAQHCAQLASITGVGARLARRVVDHGIETPEELELAAYDGRLGRIAGFGRRRVEQVRARLERHLGRPRRRQPLLPRPPVAVLLDIDREYREHAAEGVLPRIAPRRLNPHGHAWLPMWSLQRDGWTFTAMYSNTPQAYTLDKRLDWVILVYERDGQDDHCTVVTEHRGPLEGRRVVRGRERECRRHYDDQRVPSEVRRWAHEQAVRLAGDD